MIKTKIRVRGRPPKGDPQYAFDEATFIRLQKDLRAGRLTPKDGRIWVLDPMSVGLRALIGKEEIGYHVQYQLGEKRSTQVIGRCPDDPVQAIRERARVVREMAENGEDPQSLMRANMLRHLDEERERKAKGRKIAQIAGLLVDAGADVDELYERLARELKNKKR